MSKGWFLESKRHRLSALGIKTGRKLHQKRPQVTVLQGNSMFFPQSKELLKVAGLKYPKGWKQISGEIGWKKGNRFIRVVFDDELNPPSWVVQRGYYDKDTLIVEDTTLHISEASAKKFALSRLNYTPKYRAEDVGKVATDVVVGTGAEVRKYAPVIAVAKVRKWVRRKTKRKKAKKKSKKKRLYYKKSLEEKKLDKITKELVALTIERKKGKKKLNYPQAIKEKYPTVTKEITKLSLKHNLRKPHLTYGKNKRLATFIPPNTIKLSKRLMDKDRAKRKDVAQHEFKHLMDTQRTNIRDVAELERRAILFEKRTK